MMKKGFILLFCVIGFFIKAQNINLVPNYSFEDTIRCTWTNMYLNIKNWYNPNNCTPDGYDICQDDISPSLADYFKIHSGHARVGIGVFDSDTIFKFDREYLGVTLKKKLSSSKKYCFDFYTIPYKGIKYGIDKLGAYFGVGVQNYPIACGIANVTPQLNLPIGTMISDTGNWYHFIGVYTAMGNESDLVIGNFYSNPQTNSILVSSDPAAVPGCYLVIDDVSLHEMSLNMGHDTTICSGVDFTIGEENLDTAFKSYYWYHNGVLFDSIVSQKTINLTAPDSFVLEKRFACGSVFDTIYLNVSTTVCLVKSLAISNANIFSPNNDGINDVFELQLSGSKFELKSFEIFDRWGLLVYEQNISALKNTDTPDTQNTKQTIYLQWNGRTTSGETCNDGVYYYTLQAENEKGETVKQRGFVSLVR